MERIVDVEDLDRDLRLAGGIAEGRDLVGRARDRHGIMGVDRSNAEFVKTASLGKGASSLFTEHDGRHRAVAGKQVLMQRTFRNDRNGIDERQRAGGIGRGDFADGVTEDGDRLDAHGNQRIRQGGLHRKQQRLGDLRVGKLLVEIRIGQEIGERDIRMELEQRADRGETLAEMQVFAEGFHTHAGPLRAVAGEHERDLGVANDGLADLTDIRAGLFQVAGDRTDDIFGLVAASGKPMAHMGAVGTRCGDHRTGFTLGSMRESGLVILEKGFQARLRMSACEEHMSRRRRVCGLFIGGRFRVADNDVRIGAAEAERVDAGKARALTAQKLDRVCRDADVQTIEVDMLVWRVEMQRSRQVVVLKRHHGLQHAEEAGGGFRMADVRLDRADRHRRPALGADDRSDRPDFRRVADLGAGTVAFDEGHLIGVDAVSFVDRSQQVGLGFARRQRNAVGAAG